MQNISEYLGVVTSEQHFKLKLDSNWTVVLKYTHILDTQNVLEDMILHNTAR